MIFKAIEQTESKSYKPELIRLLKEQGKKIKRIWDYKEIEVSCYSIIHEEGAVFLYTNYTYFPYEENVVWELDNLEIENYNDKGVVRFQLEPYSEFLVVLKRVKKDENFSFKTKNFYKYYPEK